MTNKEYRSKEGISRSELFPILSKTPKHMKYEQEHPEDGETLALLEGRAIHKMILEPETFNSEFAIAPVCDRRTKEGREKYAKFLDKCEGMDVLTADSFEKVMDMAAAIREDPIAMKFLSGIHEKSFFWTDPDTGEKCKVRPDVLTEVDGRKYIVDYKTTDSCADGAFER